MSATAPLRWLVVTALVAAWHVAFAWRRLGENRPNATTAPYPSLGIANSLSIFRGLLNSMLAGFILTPSPFLWLPAILWSCSAIIDMVDGVAARVTNRQSQLGASLDLEFDSVSILIIVLYTISHDLMPAWYILLAVARYLFVIGLWLRSRRGLPIADLTESSQRRLEAGLQMAFLTVVLWPTVGKPYTTVAAYAFGIPFLGLFMRDWLVASTALDPHNPRYLAVRKALRHLVYDGAPLACRLLLLGLLTTGMLPLYAATPYGMLLVLATLLLLPGVVSRFAATLLLIPLVFGDGELAWRLVMIVLACCVIKFGGGPFSLWLPEETLFNTRLGGASTNEAAADL